MLQVIDFSVGYSKEKPLLGNINIKVKKGEVIGIRGKNGCGKSTLLKGILGLIQFRSGKIFLDNRDISNCNYEKIAQLGLIGYLPQKNRIFNNLTVLENLEISSYNSLLKNSSGKQLLPENFNSLYPDLNRPANFLSGGQNLILAFACLYIYNAPVLLLDEPTDSLDEKNKEIAKDILKMWKIRNKSILIIEQDYELLNEIADENYKIVETVNFNNNKANFNYPYTMLRY